MFLTILVRICELLRNLLQ